MLAYINRCVTAAGCLTPTQLARKAGLWPSTLNRFINGKKGEPPKHLLSTTTLNKLSRTSGLPLPLFFAGAPAETPEPRLELLGSDQAMARVVEDLIFLLDHKGIISLDDLPESARKLVNRRPQLRMAKAAGGED